MGEPLLDYLQREHVSYGRARIHSSGSLTNSSSTVVLTTALDLSFFQIASTRSHSDATLQQ